MIIQECKNLSKEKKLRFLHLFQLQELQHRAY